MKCYEAIDAYEKFFNPSSPQYRFSDLPFRWADNPRDRTSCGTGYVPCNIFTLPGFGFDDVILEKLSGSPTDFEVFDRIREEVKDYILLLTP